METWLDFRLKDSEAFAELNQRGRAELGFFQTPYVSWRNDVALFLGPRQSGLSALDVDDMTEVEIRSHRFMQRHCDFFRAHAPGFRDAWRNSGCGTRRLAGVARIERGQWSGGETLADEVGVSPSVSPKFPVLSVPSGALVQARVDGLLAAGRHVSCDANSHGFMREIPQCWMTGQAAGAAAALAVARGGRAAGRGRGRAEAAAAGVGGLRQGVGGSGGSACLASAQVEHFAQDIET